MRSLGFLVGTVAACLMAISTAHAEKKVVVSIKPLHALVAGVMDGAGTPDLIVEGAGSPHGYSLKPSQARTLQQADVVFWFGEDLESFLEKPLQTLPKNARVVSMIEAPGLKRLPLREGGGFERHAHGEHHDGHGEEHHNEEHHDDHDGHHEAHEAGHDDHDHEEGVHDAEHHGEMHRAFDAHVWLDPRNAQLLVTEIARVMAEADGANADRYRANAEALKKRLSVLEADLAEQLQPVADVPYIVFHDAYQYMESRFGLNAAGSVTVNPEVAPGAARVAEIREKVRQLRAVCIFAEPQFEPKLISVITEGSDVRAGVLDPLGAEVAAGPDAYFTLMRGMADSLAACLDPQS